MGGDHFLISFAQFDSLLAAFSLSRHFLRPLDSVRLPGDGGRNERHDEGALESERAAVVSALLSSHPQYPQATDFANHAEIRRIGEGAGRQRVVREGRLVKRPAVVCLRPAPTGSEGVRLLSSSRGRR